MALFDIMDQRLKVLLIRRAHPPFEHVWALPGGFLNRDENLEACALRELKEETGIYGVDLEQLYAFGDPDRDPRERVITVAYYAFMPPAQFPLQAASDADQVDWFDWHHLPDLAFDHADIIKMARERVISKLDYLTIILRSMPEKFTLGELQDVYENIFNISLDGDSFRRRLRPTYDYLVDTGELRRDGNQRGERLYRVKRPNLV